MFNLFLSGLLLRAKFCLFILNSGWMKGSFGKRRWCCCGQKCWTSLRRDLCEIAASGVKNELSDFVEEVESFFLLSVHRRCFIFQANFFFSLWEPEEGWYIDNNIFLFFRRLLNFQVKTTPALPEDSLSRFLTSPCRFGWLISVSSSSETARNTSASPTKM